MRAYPYGDGRGYSDTLRLVAQEKFRELLLAGRWKDLYEYLNERDFKGVAFVVSHGLFQLHIVTSNLTPTPIPYAG
jgi:hypothetical protein